MPVTRTLAPSTPGLDRRPPQVSTPSARGDTVGVRLRSRMAAYHFTKS